MKRFRLSLVLTILFSMVVTKSFGYDAEIDGIYYNFSGDEATVTYMKTGYTYSQLNGERLYYNSTAYNGDVVIPQTVIYNETTYNVTSIGISAFEYCNNLTSITIPNSITHIYNSAFQGCTSLNKVIVNDIAAWCSIDFYDGNSNPLSLTKRLYSDISTEITDLCIPEGVININSNAFINCEYIKSVYLPESLESIGSGAFSGCIGLTTISIPQNVGTIGNQAFSGCSFTKVEINSNAISSLSGSWTSSSMAGVFGNQVTDYVLGEGVSQIGDNAFYNCSQLKSVSLPKSLTTVFNNAFYGCTNLTDVTIADIGSWCDVKFYSDKSNPLYFTKKFYVDGMGEITELVIPEGTEIIKSYAFYNCENFVSVSIPESMKEVERDAFSGCTNLNKVNIKSIESWLNIEWTYSSLRNVKHLFYNDGTEITSLTIPEGITEIKDHAFVNCIGLISVTLPYNFKSVGMDAFYRCI
ncbi:MAG: leucine-rich repeat domain-containing protein [Prevotella sp.]|nr:leucine-rich repeat domain-containing protein [Prevotella sp.]